MKIGIVGAGISGLVAAHLLHREHDIELLEANDYLGGHTHTEDVGLSGGPYRINTGFIVFNRENYPHFVKLIEELGVRYQPAPMSFSVKCMRTSVEYGFATLDAIFAQRRNLLSPSFLWMLFEIGRFHRQFDHLLNDPESERLTLGAYLKARGFSRRFVEQFVVPFGAAIWSADPDAFGDFPLRTFVSFFKNHGFLHEERLLQWYTITGGSDRYVEKITRPFANKIFKGVKARRVVRAAEGVDVHLPDGRSRHYDQVVLAVHSDQALEMIEAPTAAEREVLRAMPYQPNDVVLHTDEAVLPNRRKTWSSWNYCIPARPATRCTATYHMNILQSIESASQFLVTLNQSAEIDERKVLGRYVCDHPIYNTEGVKAQKRHAEISGSDRLHFAGAYWGYGFHEDGVNSALAACRPFGVTL